MVSSSSINMGSNLPDVVPQVVENDILQRAIANMDRAIVDAASSNLPSPSVRWLR